MDNFNTIAVTKNLTVNSLVNSFAKRKVTDDDKIAYIKLLLFKTAIMVVMYDLRETNIYQRGLKKSGNEFLSELQKGIFDDRYFDLLSSDAKAVEEMEKSIEEMAEQISKSSLGCFAVINETLKKYQQSPDYVLDRLNILKGDSEDIPSLQRREDLINRMNKLPIESVSLIENYISGLENIYLTQK